MHQSEMLSHNVFLGQHTCSCYYCLAVRRHSQIKDSEGVACQRGQLAHRWVLPDNDLVLAVAMCAHDLVHILAPQQIAHLAACPQQ